MTHASLVSPSLNSADHSDNKNKNKTGLSDWLNCVYSSNRGVNITEGMV